METLKYLFTATFEDGTVIEQTQEDRSVLDPDKRSCFYDVVEKEKESPLVKFTLKGSGHEYGVDLVDGHFEVDGLPFNMIKGTLPEYRIIYYRNVTRHFNAADGEQTGSQFMYCIGWQCTDDGKNYQRVMEIA